MPSSPASRSKKPKRKVSAAWKRRPSVTNQNEAIDSIMEGLSYFVKKHPYRTLTTIGLLLLGTVYATKYFVFEKQNVEFETRKPFSEAVEYQDTVPDGLLMGALYASEPRSSGGGSWDTLWIRGRAWGIPDRNYVIQKLYGEPVIVIRDMRDSLADPLFLKVEALDDKILKNQQYQKSN